MRNILVAIDGSVGAERAIDYAAQMAKDYRAPLLIANIIGGFNLPSAFMEQLTQAQDGWLDEFLTSLSAQMLTKAQAHARSVGVETIQLESHKGDVAQSILEIAQENGIDLVVVGKRGAGRIQGLLLGSISQKLVSLAPVPVTVVP